MFCKINNYILSYGSAHAWVLFVLFFICFVTFISLLVHCFV